MRSASDWKARNRAREPAAERTDGRACFGVKTIRAPARSSASEGRSPGEILTDTGVRAERYSPAFSPGMSVVSIFCHVPRSSRKFTGPLLTTARSRPSLRRYVFEFSVRFSTTSRTTSGSEKLWGVSPWAGVAGPPSANVSVRSAQSVAPILTYRPGPLEIITPLPWLTIRTQRWSRPWSGSVQVEAAQE